MIVRRRPGLVDVGLPAGATVDLVTMQLPPGKWALSSVTNGYYDGNPGATFWCYLLVDGAAPEPAQALALGTNSGAIRAGMFAPAATVVSAAATTVVLRCGHEQAIAPATFGPYFGPSRIVATRADTLDVAGG